MWGSVSWLPKVYNDAWLEPGLNSDLGVHTVCRVTSVVWNGPGWENVPSLSIVSLILLAAFSLRSPGWLLLMENKVMTPIKKEIAPNQSVPARPAAGMNLRSTSRVSQSLEDLDKLLSWECSLSCCYKCVATMQATHPEWGSSRRQLAPLQWEPAQTRHGICSFCSPQNRSHSQSLHPPAEHHTTEPQRVRELIKSSTFFSVRGSDSTSAIARMATVRTKGMDQVTMWK